jgi:diguanylate cyclase (GGDEF)-like protein
MNIERFRRLSLEALLAWGFGSLIVGGLLTAVLALLVWRFTDAAFVEYERQNAPILQQASKGLDAWMKVRHQEERIMMSSAENVGAAEAKTRYLPQWKGGLDDIRDYLRQVRRLADGSDRKVVALLPAIDAALARYTESFSSALDSMVRLGGPDSGLAGDMRAKARAAESVLADTKVPVLAESLLKLRRIRTDFAVTGNEQAFKEFSEEAARFESLSAGVPKRQVLLDLVKEYGALFRDYVQVTRDVNAKKRAFMETATFLGSGLEQLEHEALENARGGLQSVERRITRMTQVSALIALIATMLGAVGAVFVSRRIRLAAQRVIGFAGRVAAGKLETRLQRVGGGEFGALESALNTMADRLQESEEAMSRQARGLEASNRRIALLSEMTGLLQTAASLEEAATISARHLSRMHLARGGALYLYNESHNHLDAIARWGDVASVEGFVPGDCWAIRRGRPYGSIDGNAALVCPHAIQDGEEPLYLCLPMVTEGGVLGLVYVAFERTDSAVPEADVRFARRLSEQLGLALANLRLREAMRAQTFGDALTGLFNRRYLEESLPREFSRAAREKKQIAVLMIDADHFKRYNDVHGHAAGDAALRRLGQVLKANCRGADLACRYGGEEFTVVLPGTGREGARTWAARLLDNVRQMEISLQGKILPGMTVSIGVALYPEHGVDADAVMKTADLALYDAKHLGRNRVAMQDT